MTQDKTKEDIFSLQQRRMFFKRTFPKCEDFYQVLDNGAADAYKHEIFFGNWAEIAKVTGNTEDVNTKAKQHVLANNVMNGCQSNNSSSVGKATTWLYTKEKKSCEEKEKKDVFSQNTSGIIFWVLYFVSSPTHVALP